MVRPRKHRHVAFDPEVTYFKPRAIPLSELEEVVITKDEIESMRLAEIEGMDQNSAAERMNISQSTFHRIIGSARKKIAEALVEGKAMKIEGGTVKMVGRGRRGKGRGAGRGKGAGRREGRGRGQGRNLGIRQRARDGTGPRGVQPTKKSDAGTAQKIAVASSGNTFESTISPVFGRSEYFLFASVADGKVSDSKSEENALATRKSGTGTATAQYIAEQGAEVLIVANIGPKALDVLTQLGVPVYKAEGKAKEAIAKYLSGELERFTAEGEE